MTTIRDMEYNSPMYLVLAIIFFSTLITGLGLFIWLIFNLKSPSRYLKRMMIGYLLWLIVYASFIVFGTGPVGERLYTGSASAPYKLPWRAGISRFVSQGNRSFTSHRGVHLYAWDFWMPIGTEILAARAGIIARIEQGFDGIGLNSNYIIVEHDDKTRAMYAHIKKNGAMVTLGDRVQQGQLIAYSGMVGQTINPHLHFVVFNQDETKSLPIIFSDISEGVPLAGHFYTSGNADH